MAGKGGKRELGEVGAGEGVAGGKVFSQFCQACTD